MQAYVKEKLAATTHTT